MCYSFAKTAPCISSLNNPDNRSPTLWALHKTSPFLVIVALQEVLTVPTKRGFHNSYLALRGISPPKAGFRSAKF